MLTREEVVEIAKECGDDWDSTLPEDREFIERFAQAVYRRGVEDAMGVSDIDSFKAIRKLTEE